MQILVGHILPGNGSCGCAGCLQIYAGHLLRSLVVNGVNIDVGAAAFIAGVVIGNCLDLYGSLIIGACVKPIAYAVPVGGKQFLPGLALIVGQEAGNLRYADVVLCLDIQRHHRVKHGTAARQEQGDLRHGLIHMRRSADLRREGSLHAVLVNGCNDIEVFQTGFHVLVHILQRGTSFHISKLAVVAGGSPAIDPIAHNLQLRCNAPGQLVLLIPGNDGKAEHLPRRCVIHLCSGLRRNFSTVHIRQSQSQRIRAGFQLGQLPSDL